MRNLTEQLTQYAAYHRDRRNIGFAPEVKPGANLRHSFETEKDHIYYLQISSRATGGGAYILRVD